MNIKKIIAAGVGLATACVIGSTALADEDISIYVDNALVETDQAPVILQDRTMVPIRAVFEKAGAQVDWNDSTKTATIKRDNYTVIIKLNQPYIYKNSKPIALDVPSAVVNDRIVIPVRAIAEAMDFGVTWNSVTKSVLISTDGQPYRANAQWQTGFRDTNSAGIMLEHAFENLQIDLNGDGSSELVSFVPASGEARATLKINDMDYSNFLPNENGGVMSIGFIDVCKNDSFCELMAVDGDDERKALFFRYNGQELTVLKSNGSEDGTITFIDKLFFDGIENIISDIDGICFTNPMICTSMYSLEDTEIKRYSLREDLAKMLTRQIQAEFDDQMTYNVKYTDKYEAGKYLSGSIQPDGIVNSSELPHNVMTINSIECDSIDPSRFEIYVKFANGMNAVIWPYSA